MEKKLNEMTTEELRRWERQQKEKFVTQYLSPLLKAAKIEVDCAVYSFDDTNGEEIVTVYYTNGYKKNICVSADSLRAIVIDVTTQCG